MRSIALISLFLVSAALVGCNNGEQIPRLKTIPVKGTLYLDGKPYGNCTLTLTPDSPDPDPKKPTKHGAGATVNADGTFVLKTYEDGDGAVPGKYEAALGAEMGKMQMGSVPVVEPNVVEIAQSDNGKPVDLKIDLKSTGETADPTGVRSKEMSKKTP
ncbi:MAG TPA: hypothetical protein VKU82_08875 [Planctomycetaceae bacterium]|nr:hypothetical protein [Planctomycetaceae bacterium]